VLRRMVATASRTRRRAGSLLVHCASFAVERTGGRSRERAGALDEIRASVRWRHSARCTALLGRPRRSLASIWTDGARLLLASEKQQSRRIELLPVKARRAGVRCWLAPDLHVQGRCCAAPAEVGCAELDRVPALARTARGA
jgi:hypothetical protein